MLIFRHEAPHHRHRWSNLTILIRLFGSQTLQDAMTVFRLIVRDQRELWIFDLVLSSSDKRWTTQIVNSPAFFAMPDFG